MQYSVWILYHWGCKGVPFGGNRDVKYSGFQNTPYHWASCLMWRPRPLEDLVLNARYGLLAPYVRDMPEIKPQVPSAGEWLQQKCRLHLDNGVRKTASLASGGATWKRTQCLTGPYSLVGTERRQVRIMPNHLRFHSLIQPLLREDVVTMRVAEAMCISKRGERFISRFFQLIWLFSRLFVIKWRRSKKCIILAIQMAESYHE